MIPRSFHRRYALLLGYFWLPCPRCGRMFGGHECGGTDWYADDAGFSGRLCCSNCKDDRYLGCTDDVLVPGDAA